MQTAISRKRTRERATKTQQEGKTPEMLQCASTCTVGHKCLQDMSLRKKKTEFLLTAKSAHTVSNSL